MPPAAYPPSPSIPAQGDAESPFEESVISVIRSWGYELTPHVGTAGYRVDIGIRPPIGPASMDIGHIGARIRDNIDAAIRIAGVMRDGEFLSLTGAPFAMVRTPTDACRREVKHVQDHELTLAVTNLVRDAGGISHDELTTRVARLYGWTRRGPDISNRLHALIERLMADGALTGSEQNLTTPS